MSDDLVTKVLLEELRKFHRVLELNPRGPEANPFTRQSANPATQPPAAPAPTPDTPERPAAGRAG